MMEQNEVKTEPRQIGEINLEYTNICAEIGNKSVRLKRLISEIDSLQKRGTVLASEADQAMLIEAKATAAAKKIKRGKK